jgi:hypothetical protein
MLLAKLICVTVALANAVRNSASDVTWTLALVERVSAASSDDSLELLSEVSSFGASACSSFFSRE